MDARRPLVLVTVAIGVLALASVSAQVVNPQNGHVCFAQPSRTCFEFARHVADLVGGYVTTINDADEEIWVRDTVAPPGHHWIGLTDEIEEGVFVWDSGEPVVYTSWLPGEPDGGDDVDHVIADSDEPGLGWQDSEYEHSAVIETEQPLEPGVENLHISHDLIDVFATWENPTTYTSIEIYRDAELIATLAGDATSFVEPFVECDPIYTVFGRVGSGRAVPRLGRIAPSPALTLTDETAAEGELVDVEVLIDNPCTIHFLSGWRFGVCYDTTELLLTDLLFGEVLASWADGLGPEFYQEIVDPDQGFAVNVISSFFLAALPPDVGQEVHIARFETLAPALTPVPLEFCDTIGDPPVEVVVVLDGQRVHPRITTGAVSIVAGFRRGDCNGDQGLDIADVLALGDGLFGGGTISSCADSLDGNDDGLLAHRRHDLRPLLPLSRGPEPPPPFPGCGDDPGGALGCAESQCL